MQTNRWILTLALLIPLHLWAGDNDGDEMPEPHVLTLHDLLEQVAAHPEIKADNFNIESAQVDRRAAMLKFAPSASLAQTWMSPDTTDQIKDNTQSVNLSLNLFHGFQDITTLKAARFGVQESSEDHRQKLLTATRLATETYLTCLQLKKNENEARQALDIRRQIAQIERARYEKGVRSRDDVVKLELDANNAELDLKHYVGSKMACLAQLAYWSGPFDTVAEVTYEGLAAKALQESAPADLLQHPTLRSVMAEQEKTKWSLRQTRGAFLPTLHFAYAGFPGTSFQAPSHQWLLTANFSLFDSGVTLQNMQHAQVARDIADEKRAYIERQLKSQLDQARENLRYGYETYIGRKKNLELAQQLLASSLRRFRAGTSSSNDVALDQNRVVLSQFGFHDSWLQMNLAWVEYQAAQGILPSDGI